MNITGVIAEYNPFHNGHKYQLETARTRTNADYMIVIMNGDFMQRGIPAFWNKYIRSAMAIEHGADAVIELPTLYGTASAEFFALGGVRLLNQLQCIQHLCFGCETEQIDLLQTIADLLMQEPDSYRSVLNQQLSRGISYPKARAKAISASLSSGISPDDELTELLSQPNTILGIEYLKALKREHSPIQAVPCIRTDAGYHHTGLEPLFSSATAIRKEYAERGCTPELSQVLPNSVYDTLMQTYQSGSPIDMMDFYPYLQYILWKPVRPLTDYLDISEDLANRIYSVYRPEYNYQQLVAAIINKQYTYTRIFRALLHILLDIRKTDMTTQLASNSMHYARLLAFRKSASPLIRELNRNSIIPIINKVPDGIRMLTKQGNMDGVHLLEQDIACAHLYEQAFVNRYNIPAANDYTKGVIIKE